jgi:hypothetical protein
MGPPDTERGPGEGLVPDGAAAGGTSVPTIPPGTVGEAGPLRAALDRVIAEQGCSLKDLTVLAPQNDPFRVDTPARHRDGEWLATTARDLGLGERKIHLRGLHYMMIGRPKPGGAPYRNTDADWLWLQGDAAKAARWLGYIPFDQIVDQRNAEPEVREYSRPEPWAYLTVGIDVDLPDAADIMPGLAVEDFRGVQPYRITMAGEKSSLADVLGPVARDYGADLYLPTGEMSDPLVYRIARTAAADERPLVVLYFADCDPAGWQMPISAGRKLQAFRELLGGRFEFEVHRVALTPDQVREYGLPSTPLKDTEKRAGSWQREMHVEQTEIDALASLRPDLLRQIARDALAPFYDHDLGRRVAHARSEWIRESLEIINRDVDGERLARIRAEAERKLAGMREQIAELNDQLRIDAGDFDLPEMVIPGPDLDGREPPHPLLESWWPFAEQCQALIDSKAYRVGP